MFAMRAVLAATLSPSWGVYSGFELFEHQAVRPGSEEYLDSEKYQLRPRDFAPRAEPGLLAGSLITQLNGIRRLHPALQQMKGLWFHSISNDKLLCYSRRDPVTRDVVIVITALDGKTKSTGRDRILDAGARPGLARPVRGGRPALR